MHVLLIIALVQGLTEFLPVSSSGHLTLASELLGLEQRGHEREALFVMLHGASLLAILIGMRSAWLRLLHRDRIARALAIALVGSVPAAAVGLGLRAAGVEGLFDQLWVAGLGWLLTAGLLLLTRKGEGSGWTWDSEGPIPWGRVFLVGCAQAMAIAPGVSRSGSTIAAALLLGIERKTAFELSFLLAMPAIGGAMLLDAPALASLGEATGALGLFLAALVGFASSLIALILLRGIVERRQLHKFAPYCLVLGLATLVWSLWLL